MTPVMPSPTGLRGGYLLADADGGTPGVLLIGTGSEVQVALGVRDLLQSHGIPARVVSMPCVGWFAAQDLAYRDTVLPPGIRARVSVEAGSAAVGKDHRGRRPQRRRRTLRRLR
jgi:transketolase